MNDETEAALIAEQLKHTIALLRAEIQAIRAEQKHERQMVFHRLEALEMLSRDHETRLRTVSDGVTQFKVWAGLASGGSSFVSLLALLRTWLGA